MKIRCIQSDEILRLKETELLFEDGRNEEMKLVKVYPQETRQTIEGFGGAFTEAAAYTLNSMSEENKEKVLSAYFGPDGNQYNFCRTHIQSCDFALGNYSYVENPEDTELTSFSIERDKKYLIPMIQQAIAREPDMQLMASPWSPPAFMKSNGEMNRGGFLKKEYYQMWSDMIVRYVQEYEALGIPIQRITVQNEPNAVQTWDSCLYTAEEEGIFAADYLRKGLDKSGFTSIKIAVWDHNKESILERADSTFAVPGALERVDGVAFHWYTGDHFEALGAVREKYPYKELIFTEGCVEYSRFMNNNQIKNAEMYLHDMIGNLNSGTNGSIDWNLLLNKEGGPNHVGNFCDAPIMYDSDTDTVDIKLSYYYIGHISRYIKRGAKRILVSRYTEALDVFGCINPDGEKVLVLMNKSDHDERFKVREGDKVCNVFMKAHSIMTLCW